MFVKLRAKMRLFLKGEEREYRHKVHMATEAIAWKSKIDCFFTVAAAAATATGTYLPSALEGDSKWKPFFFSLIFFSSPQRERAKIDTVLPQIKCIN